MRHTILSSIFFLALPAAALAQDFDGDGVNDRVDVLPCDASASALTFAPSQTQHGMIMFEDRWPSRGDLDFNDVVLAHHYTLRHDRLGRVTGLRARFEPMAVGGSIRNGLGLHLPVPRTAVASAARVVGGVRQALTPSPVDGELTLVLSRDLRELFAGATGQINSRDDHARVTGTAIEVEIAFASPVTISAADAPFDLYLFNTDRPAHEIHRPEYGGTANMDRALFGTADDGTSGSRSFVDTDGLPFAISLPTLAVYPREAVEISRLFPGILGFASSAGATNRDFYTSGVVASFGYAGSGNTGPLAPSVVPMAIDLSCDPDGDADGEPMSTDCDDSRPEMFHGALEVCDGLDNDCDDSVDEGTGSFSTYHRDTDGDGFGDGTITVQACAAPPGYVAYITNRCSNGSQTNCNLAGTTRIASSAYVDTAPPSGWVQCAGFINTAGDDVAHNFFDHCLNATGLRIRVWSENGTLEEDIATTGMPPRSAWPHWSYLDGTINALVRTRWGQTTFFTTTNGQDACAMASAPSGNTFGTGNGGVGIVAGGNAGGDEYRVSCNGQALPGRRIAIYASGTGRVVAPVDCNDQAAGINPGSPEICNQLDDDCNNSVDDGSGAPSRFHRDVDGDGFGDGRTFVDACAAPSGYVPYQLDLCSAGLSRTDCNVPGSTRIASSAFVDPSPPSGWLQCAGFTNTSGDDVNANFLDNCLNSTSLRIRVWGPGGAIEEDVSATSMPTRSSWPHWAYLDGNMTFHTRTRWGSTTFFTTTNGQDACGQTSAPSGTVFGTGNGSVTVVAGGNSAGDEVRVSCGGAALPDRRVAFYRAGTPAARNVDCNDGLSGASPTGAEICNGIDDDCDGAIDEGAAAPRQFHRDADGDGYGDGVTVTTACTQPSGYVPYVRNLCTNGAAADCNVAGTTRIASSAFIDQNPPSGWVQCAGFTNTAGDDVSANFLDNCLNSTSLRVRVWGADRSLEEDIAVTNQSSWSAWPSLAYLGGTATAYTRTRWGSTDFYTDASGRDACGQASAPSGTTLGTGNGGVGIIAGGNTAGEEYRISCGGAALVDRQVAIYRMATAPAAVNVDCNDGRAATNLGATEVCNGIDDDCDGVIDDGNPGGGASCGTGMGGQCGAGTVQCTSGALMCVAIAARPEACGTGVDEDCDGTTDEAACIMPCSNGSTTDCNAAGTTLISSSAWVDPAAPAGWRQCAGFINTAGDDVAHNFLNNCLSTTRMRVRVFSASGALEEDVLVGNQVSQATWPNFSYLGGDAEFRLRTRWGSTAFFTTTNGHDACQQQAAPSGITLGTGNGGVAVVAGGNNNGLEYRVSCGGAALTDRRIAIYR